jgi:uncharacterized damage-inducible protein DinB
MSTILTPARLTRYKRWADDLIFEAVQALPAGEADKLRPTLFKSMLGTLNHSYVVDLVWQAHLEARPHGISALNSVLHEELGELWHAQRAVDDWYVALSDSLSEQALGEVVQFQFVDGKPGSLSRGEILMHVVNHATYHRGWVADMFFQVPARPPTTDLPVFLARARGPSSSAAAPPGAAPR